MRDRLMAARALLEAAAEDLATDVDEGRADVRAVEAVDKALDQIDAAEGWLS